jgi:hypothetical protein
MITMKIEEETLVSMLIKRLKEWVVNPVELDLYEQLWTKRASSGYFDGAELDVMSIVDNDIVNNTQKVYVDDRNYEDVLKCFKGENSDYTILAVSDKKRYDDGDESPFAFLVAAQ